MASLDSGMFLGYPGMMGAMMRSSSIQIVKAYSVETMIAENSMHRPRALRSPYGAVSTTV